MESQFWSILVIKGKIEKDPEVETKKKRTSNVVCQHVILLESSLSVI